MQFCASKNVDQFASEKPAQFDWILHNRLKNRISGHYYENYTALKEAIPLENKGELDISPFEQLGFRAGLKINRKVR